jgi:hypothetical protein
MMLGWLYRWRERRIMRAWSREAAGDRGILEKYYDYEDAGDGVVVMTPKRGSGEDGDAS